MSHTASLLPARRYLAPEVVEQRGHTCAADLWALGVLIHCLLTGETPFALPGDDELQIYRRICSTGDDAGAAGSSAAAGDADADGAALHEGLPLADGLSPQAVSLLTGLLTRDPAKRLGAGPCGFAQLKAHPWFGPVDWQALVEQRCACVRGLRAW